MSKKKLKKKEEIVDVKFDQIPEKITNEIKLISHAINLTTHKTVMDPNGLISQELADFLNNPENHKSITQDGKIK